MIDKVFVAKGTAVTVPIQVMNTSTDFWGQDAKDFRPERWLDDGKSIPDAAKSIQGYHHLLTFADGPRTCIGKMFAITEFKVRVLRRIHDLCAALRCRIDRNFCHRPKL